VRRTAIPITPIAQYGYEKPGGVRLLEEYTEVLE